MTEPKSGLRFDIYERIHLADGAAGIGQLDEVELVPRIRVTSHNEQAVLKGHLLLTGKYEGEGTEEELQALEHQIPVEITVPIHRLRSAADIAVEIENFDVDVLSTRSLNVTGVLSLQGIDLSSGEARVKDEEEKVFIHEAKRPAPAAKPSAVQTDKTATAAAATASLEPAPGSGARQLPAAEQEHPAAALSQGQQAAPAVFPADKVWSSFPAPETRRSSPAAEPEAHSEEVESLSEPPSPELDAVAAAESDLPRPEAAEAQDEAHGETEAVPAAEPVSAEPAAAEPEPAGAAAAESGEETPAAKQEVKIAFTGKKQEAQESGSSKYDLTSLLGKSSAAETRAEAAGSIEPASDEAAPARSSGGQSSQEESQQAYSRSAEPAAESSTDPASEGKEGLEWKRMFLPEGDSGQREFRRLRMCIVQKDETIETIAERYQIKSREIQLYNRLDSVEVEAGQVIYIP